MNISEIINIHPVPEGKTALIEGKFYPVTGLVKANVGVVPLVDIPQMSDETRNRLAEKDAP